MTTYTIDTVPGTNAGSEKFVCNDDTGTMTPLGGPFIYFDNLGVVKSNLDHQPAYPVNEFNGFMRR